MYRPGIFNEELELLNYLSSFICLIVFQPFRVLLFSFYTPENISKAKVF